MSLGSATAFGFLFNRGKNDKMKTLVLNITMLHHLHINTCSLFFLFMCSFHTRTFYLMCALVYGVSVPSFVTYVKWKPDGKHLVSPSGIRGAHVSVRLFVSLSPYYCRFLPVTSKYASMSTFLLK